MAEVAEFVKTELMGKKEKYFENNALSSTSDPPSTLLIDPSDRSNVTPNKLSGNTTKLFRAAHQLIKGEPN